MNRSKLWICLLLVVAAAPISELAAMSYHQYMGVVKRYTKLQQEYSFETFTADLLWGLIYLVPEAKEAIWNRESWITEKPISESKFLPPDKVRGTQFIIGVFAPVGTERFDLEKDTFWSMKLDMGGDEYTPVAIDPIDNNVLARRLVPFVHKWTRLYLVTFAGDFQPPFTVRMVGDSAKSEIKWKALAKSQ